MGISIFIGGQDYTDRYESLTFSNVDPGGFEAATITVKDDTGVFPGQVVTIYSGCECAWMGRVNEPGPKIEDRRVQRTITCLGAGIVLKDERIQEVFVDRGLSKFLNPSATRQLYLVNVLNQPGSFDTSYDNAIVCRIGPKSSTSFVLRVEPTYFSQVPIGDVYVAWSMASSSSSNGDLELSVLAGSDADYTSYDTTGQLRPSDGFGGFLTSGTALFGPAAGRYVIALNFVNTIAGVTYTQEWQAFWTCVAIYGRHGLTKRGSNSTTDAKGFYPADIAQYAAQQAGGFGSYVIGTDPNLYVLGHASYQDPVPHERIIDDMAKYLGWHWGAWEPQGVMETLPSFWFTPTPTQPTVWISQSDGELDPPKVRLDTLYDTCNVTYTDVTGATHTTTVTLTNPLLQRAGLTGRVLDLNVGLSTLARAQDQGNAALALAQTTQRGGGSVTLRSPVRKVGPSYQLGQGRKPAELVRAGRERMRIVNLPDSGYFHDSDTRRYDTFHIRRVETTVTRGDAPTTRIEFDGGADLLEVLQARLEVQRIITGA